MYLKNILINNIGPISDFKYDFRFENNNPVPLIVIGENGKGKTILSSYIADLFIELAKKSYHNVVEVENAFYRVVGGSNVRSGAGNGYVLVNSKDEDKEFCYYSKCGTIDLGSESVKFSDFIKLSSVESEFSRNKLAKGIINISESVDIFDKKVLTFFPSYRNEKPNWMNLDAIKYNSEYSTNEKINGVLNKEIIVEHSEERNSVWLEKLLGDSRIGFEKNESGSYKYMQPSGITITSLELLDQINMILSKILKQASYLELNHRLAAQRFSIKTSHGTIPSLKNLSLGESILFNLFCTIIRHGEKQQLLKNITGVVVIDEIDMHLDSDMQYSVLPELISLFPKVQFVITSHSPLFLLGMKKKFSDNCDFIEMPDGKYVDVEAFNEFKHAYDILKDTKKYNQEIMDKVNESLNNISNDKALIITEGSTDWRHMKNAFEKLCSFDESFAADFEGVKFEFLEYTSDIAVENNIQMGDSALENMCASLSKYRPGRKIICIGDNDVAQYVQKLNNKDSFRKWSDDVFSFTIPIVDNREESNISIEHYYLDEEIKTPVVDERGISRRMFLGSEFNSDGFSLEEDYYCQSKNKCGIGKIGVLDGESGAKIYKVSDMKSGAKVNYGLSKTDFVKYIENNEIVICQESYNNFKKIFYVIKGIIKNG